MGAGRSRSEVDLERRSDPQRQARRMVLAERRVRERTLAEPDQLPADLRYPQLQGPAASGLQRGESVRFPFGQLVLQVQNIFNDRYALTLNNSLQGTHWAQPRAFYFKFILGNTQ